MCDKDEEDKNEEEKKDNDDIDKEQCDDNKTYDNDNGKRGGGPGCNATDMLDPYGIELMKEMPRTCLLL